ncbi:hypothetical protein E5288_WYG002571 [Bos mutus]|uniref:Uncharacterized protein n=1 Tax=Bos mutus TaxID=72004 RepID=A0A6B0R0S1_9CETA|nr:hypothetical protein [Bos mutus]
MSTEQWSINSTSHFRSPLDKPNVKARCAEKYDHAYTVRIGKKVNLTKVLVKNAEIFTEARNTQIRYGALYAGSCSSSLPLLPSKSVYLLLTRLLEQTADAFWATEAAVGGVRTHPRSGSYSSRAAAADLLLRATMAEPGTLNLNNEVSTEVWKRVGLIFGGLRTAFLRLLEGSGSKREVRLIAQADFPEL